MKFPTEKHLQNFENDAFGYRELTRKILDDIIIEMEPPNCFGLYGNWGSGKSTMINYMIKHIEDTPAKYNFLTTVYFEPWKYEYSDRKDLLFALLACIKEKCNIDPERWKKLMTDALVITSGLLRFTKVADVKKVKDDFKLFEDKIFEEHEIWIDKVRGVQKTFKDIVVKVLEETRSEKLIVFIDDLDRCLPENAVKLLEGIKNFLYVDNTLFVLAIDRRVMSEMIEKKYGLHYGYGGEYLTKIVHYYYELPKNDLSQIVKEILGSHGINFNEKQEKYINEFLKKFVSEPRIAKHLLHQFGMKIALSEKAQELIVDDSDTIQLQYFFVATYLLVHFPHLFTAEDSRERLKNIQESAKQAKKPDRSRNYDDICSCDKSITPNERTRLEAVIYCPIKTDKEASSLPILDTERLNVALGIIRRI
ncbi:KAP family NTPase [Patescibacteria group bacterium]|nr:KAP family NTPase [Patescibacteria group bacterium]